MSTWASLAQRRLAAVLAERGAAAEADRVGTLARSIATRIGLVLPAVPSPPLTTRGSAPTGA
jgi:hypothetical protein